MNAFGKLYKELRGKPGAPQGQWSLWCKRPKTEREREEVIIGAVLTQRTNWKNVELALNNLKRAKAGSLKDVYRLGVKKTAPLIKPAGFYLTKAGYLAGVAGFVIKNYGGVEGARKADPRKLRDKLLAQKGIGPETADNILLYALDKPCFVIDEYTRRLVKKRRLAPNEAARARSAPLLRTGLARNLSYDFLQKLFEKNLRRDFRLFQDFHALIVIDGKSRK